METSDLTQAGTVYLLLGQGGGGGLQEVQGV